MRITVSPIGPHATSLLDGVYEGLSNWVEPFAWRA